MSSDTLSGRIKKLNSIVTNGSCVIYVMSRDQRVNDNHALLAAQKHALSKKLPLAVVFCLQQKTGNRSREQYEFMISGLRSVEKTLATYNIPFMMLLGEPKPTLKAVMHHTKPDAVYFDFNPLRGPQKLQRYIADIADCSVFVVDTHNIVPLWVASDKQEYAAYTMRPKIHKLLSQYLLEPEKICKHTFAWPGKVKDMQDLQLNIHTIIHAQKRNGTEHTYTSGESAAHKYLDEFIVTKLKSYNIDRNNPAVNGQSGLSPYLHFGQIASLRVALKLREVSLQNKYDIHLLQSPKMPQANDAIPQTLQSIDSILEELIVRKELADNFCFYCPEYDNINAAPKWAKDSLDKHRTDQRDYLYSFDQLEKAQTHDNAWNSAQKQLTNSGKMHGYMRMYWAKKVLEWTESPEQAIEYLIKLNDFYSIDGGDPNGYAGILWSVAGVHDRPWTERQIFGAIRYMNYEGLKRKFSIADYETK